MKLWVKIEARKIPQARQTDRNPEKQAWTPSGCTEAAIRVKRGSALVLVQVANAQLNKLVFASGQTTGALVSQLYEVAVSIEDS
jgi:hypothetical protein